MSSNQNNNVCEVCEVCEVCSPEVRLYECSNQYWCEDCAEQVPCNGCGCWYFETETGLCGDCLYKEALCEICDKPFKDGWWLVSQKCDCFQCDCGNLVRSDLDKCDCGKFICKD